MVIKDKGNNHGLTLAVCIVFGVNSCPNDLMFQQPTESSSQLRVSGNAGIIMLLATTGATDIHCSQGKKDSNKLASIVTLKL